MCGNTGSHEILEKVLQEIERREVTLNPIATNAMLSALVHCGMIEDMFDEYLNLPLATIETYGVLLLACARSSLERVSDVWSAIKEKELVPSLYCYNTLLLCLRDSTIPDHMTVNCDHVTTVPNVTKTLKANKKVVLNLHTFSLTLYLSGKHRWLEPVDVKEFFSSMRSSRVRADVRTYSILMSLVIDVHSLLKKSHVALDGPLLKAASDRLRLLGDKKGFEVSYVLSLLYYSDS